MMCAFSPFATDGAETLRAVLDEPQRVLFRVRQTEAGRFAVERYDVLTIGRRVHCGWTEVSTYNLATHADGWARKFARRYEDAHPGTVTEIIDQPVTGRRLGKSYSFPARDENDEHRLTRSQLLGGL